MSNKLTRAELKELTYAQKIDYYSHLNNLISINNGNEKTGIGCFTLSMPAGITCRPDAPCAKGCYAKKGRQTFPNVCSAYYKNYRIWQETPNAFEGQLDAFLTFAGISLIRLNDSGDFPDGEYLAMLCRVFAKHPEVKGLAYTKKFDLVNKFLSGGGIIPDNFTIRFSAWDKKFKIDNPFNLPMAYVDFKQKSDNPEIPSNAFECKCGKEITCSACRVCFNKSVQTVKFHEH